MAGCSDLELFFDRELDDVQAAAFRDHLAGCSRCQEKIRGLMLEAMTAVLGPPVAGGDLSRPWLPADEETKK
jgi:hypothetical protein